MINETMESIKNGMRCALSKDFPSEEQCKQCKYRKHTRRFCKKEAIKEGIDALTELEKERDNAFNGYILSCERQLQGFDKRFEVGESFENEES